MEPKDLEQIIGRHLKAIYQALVDGGAESRLLGSEGSVHVDANQGHDIVSFVDVREGKARKLAALLEVEPVLASGHELFELCLLYTSDAADDLLCVDLGGRRI